MTADELLNPPDDPESPGDTPDDAAIPAEPEMEAVDATDEDVSEDTLAEAAPETSAEPEPDLLSPAAMDSAMPPESLGAPAHYPPPEALPAVAWPRTGIPAVPVGVLLIALGIILLWPLLSGGSALLPAAVAAILIAGSAFSLFLYWLRSGRRARGAFFVALWGIITAAVTGLFAQAPEVVDAQSGWPLYLVGTGAAIFVTAQMDRARGRHLLPLCFGLVVGGLVALAVTRGMIPAAALEFARQEWRWLAVILVLGLLPLAFRRRILTD